MKQQKETIKSLQAKHTELSNEQTQVREKINALINAKEIPKWESKYKGKYFKFKDRHHTRETEFFMYYFCKSITESHYGICDHFYSSANGNHHFEFEKEHRLTGLKIEITKGEYLEALAQLFINSQKLLNRKTLSRDRKHDHYWIKGGILHESYYTIRGLRWREIMKLPGWTGSVKRLTVEQIIQIEDKYLNNYK